jgi:hypothetical protein
MRFVFIDSRITDISNIVSAFTPDVNHYVFDWNIDTFLDLKSKITQEYDSIGIIQHNFYESTYRLLFNSTESIIKRVKDDDPCLVTWMEYIEFLQWIKTNCNVTYIDLFACDIWNDPDWRYVIQTIDTQLGISIRASLNVTGEGGDFILESHDFNTVGVYFTEEILQYKYAFSYQAYTEFEPYGNRYSSTYILPDSNPGTLKDIYRSTSTAITFPTLTSSISNVKYVVSNGNAAVVRLITGNAVVVGLTANGGNPSQTIKDILNNSRDVVSVVCNDTAFCATYRVNGDNLRRVVHWGYYGASDIETIGTGNANFNNISTVQSSLDLVDISDIAVNQSGAFAVLDTSGDVYAWGNKATGGDPANATNTAGVAGGISSLLAGTDASFGLCTRLICGQKHFGVISSNRLGVVWGNKTSATSGGFIYNTSVTGVDDILLATDNLQNCIFLRIPETANPFSVSVSNINTSGTVSTQSLFTGLTAKPTYVIQRMGIGRTTALITNGLSEYLWVYLDKGKRLITFGVTTGGTFQTLTADSTGLSYTNVDFFSATPSAITFKTTGAYSSFVTQVDANVTNNITNYADVGSGSGLLENAVTTSAQPRLWYKFNTEDVVGSSLTNYGTLSGGNATRNSTTIDTSIKKFGTGSLKINPSYVTLPTVSVGTGVKFSLSFWFYMTTANTNAGFVSFLTGYPFGFIYFGTTNNVLYFGFENKNYQTSFQVTNSANWNKWHFVAVSFSNNTTNTINLNGTNTTFNMVSQYNVLNYNVTNIIGSNALDANKTNNWTGYVDSLRFFNIALTSTELTNLYNEGISSYSPAFLKFNLNRQLKYVPSTNTVNAYGSGTTGNTALTETYTNAVEMYTGSNTYAVSQTSPSQYTLVEAITNANQKTTIAKTANTNVYFGPSGKGLYALEVPFSPYVSPAHILPSTNTTVSYYVSNPDLAAERWSIYALSTSSSAVVQVGDLYNTYDNPSHTYTFTNVSFPTVGDRTLYIWSVVPDLCYNILSFVLPVAYVRSPTIDTGNTKSTSSGTIRISLTDSSNIANNNVYYYYSIGTSTQVQAVNTDITFTAQTSQTNAGNNLGFAISQPGTTRIAIFCAGAGATGIRFSKITNGTWGTITSITATFDIAPSTNPGNPEYGGCTMTPDATRLIVPVGVFAGNCELYWADATGLLGSSTSLSFKRITSTTRNYMMTSVTADGSRLLVSVYNAASGQIYYSDWNGTNYGTLVPILDTTPRLYFGVYISSDKQKILYAAGSTVYWSVWNGTNYPVGTSIAITGITEVRSVAIFGYGTQSEFLISTPYGSTGAQYATWNGTGYNAFSQVSTSFIPVSIIGYGLVVDSTTIYFAGYGSSTVYIANVTSSNATTSFSTYTNSNVLFTGNGTYSFDVPGLTTQNTPYTIGVRAQNASGVSSTVSTSALPVFGDVPVISSVTVNANNNLDVVYSQAFKGTTPVTYYYSLSQDGSNSTVVTDGSFIATGVSTTATIYVVASNSAGNLVSFGAAAVYPCFLEGTNILRFNSETYQDEYIPVEKLRKDDLILTSESGYKAIHSIGYRTLFRPKDDPNPSNRLYKFTRRTCPSIFEPLYITGEHCTLHSRISDEKLAEIKTHMGDVYITEEFYRMPAFMDDRAEPYDREDTPVTIWHFALENDNVAHNYGVYANGLLVESCAIESLMEKSGMNFIE